MNSNRTISSPLPNSGGYVIGDLVIEPRLRRIRHPNGEVELTQRVLDLLHLFASEPFTVHTRETLFERIWGTLHIEDTNLTQNISVLRKALGEERKQWIRTVSRTGYSFEPPCEVRYVEDTRELAPPAAARPEPAPAPIFVAAGHTAGTPIGTSQAATALEAARAPAVRRSALASSLLSVLVAFMALATTGSRPATSVMTAPASQGPARNISVVITRPATATTDKERWAANLLREWVRWKLARLPSVDLVEEEDLVAGRATPSYFLDLNVSASQAHPDRFIFDVAFRPVYRTGAASTGSGVRSGIRRSISLRGDNERLPAMIDTASNAAISIVLPHMQQERWPELDLDSSTAARFAEAAAAGRHRDANALQILQRVVQEAPKFGPARMLLAVELADRKQFRQAAEQAALGRALSTPLPPDAAFVLEAEAAALTPEQSEKALRQYSLLSTAHPERMDFVLTQATVLQRLSRPEAAFQLLSRPKWNRQTGPLRIRQLIARADSAFMLGYLEQSEQSSVDAIERIERDPEGLQPELGAAHLISARMRAQRYYEDDLPQQFAKAAVTFSGAGYAHDADVARFYEALYINDIPLAEKRLARVLKSAQEYGDHRNEIWTQRMMAVFYGWYGEREKSVLMYKRGLESANLAGDIPSSQLLEMDLMEVDLRTGDLRQAKRRVERLRENRLWTKYRYRAARVESDLLFQLGRYREALAILDRILGDAGRTTRWDMPENEAGSIACARLSLLVIMREIDAARAQAPSCHDHDPAQASLSQAGIDLLAGDADAANHHMQAAEKDIDTTPDDWDDVVIATQLAMLKIRLRDYAGADTLLGSLYRTPSAHLGYGALLAEIEVGLAEVAAARGDWIAVAENSAKVRKRLPDDARYFTDRLDALEVSRLRSEGRGREAQAIAAALANRAHQHGDALFAMETHTRHR